MAKYKPKYTYNEIAKFIELCYVVMKYEINPKFIPFDLVLLNKHKVVNVRSAGKSINGWNQNGLIYIDPNSFIEYDEEYFEEIGKHLSKMQMKWIVIDCVAHEISHTGQRIHYIDNLFDKSKKLTQRMETSNELYTLDWIYANSDYLVKYLGRFAVMSEFSRYHSHFDEFSINDYEHLSSWNEKLLDQLDYLFMLNTKGFLKESLKRGFKEFMFSLSSNGSVCYATFNIKSVLELENAAIDILKFINNNINIYKSFITEINVDKSKTILDFHLIEKDRMTFSKLYNTNIYYSFDYDPEIKFIEEFSYKDRFIESNLS